MYIYIVISSAIKFYTHSYIVTLYDSWPCQIFFLLWWYNVNISWTSSLFNNNNNNNNSNNNNNMYLKFKIQRIKIQVLWTNMQHEVHKITESNLVKNNQ